MLAVVWDMCRCVVPLIFVGLLSLPLLFYCHQAMYTNTHAAIAEDMYMTMSQLRGFWVKLGQYISTRADMVCIFLSAVSPSDRIHAA